MSSALHAGAAAEKKRAEQAALRPQAILLSTIPAALVKIVDGLKAICADLKHMENLPQDK